MKDISWLRRRGCIYWYDQYVLNEQATAFAKYDPDRIVNEICATGAEVVALYATNQYGIAYYPSAIWPQHPNLRGRDYFGELCERFQARNCKVIAYVNWLDSKHPEWTVAPPTATGATAGTNPAPLAGWADPSAPHGRVQAVAGGEWNLPCCNSPHREDMLAVVEEICSRYPADMFHIDMFFQGYCLCDSCSCELRQLFGVETVDMQTITSHRSLYVDWRAETSAAFIRAITNIAHRHGMLTAHNGFAPLLFDPVQGLSDRWLPSLDVFVSECFDAFQLPPTDLNATSITVRWQHAIEKPAWILRTAQQLVYSHWALTTAQWDLYAAACKANGCAFFGPCGVGARPDTTTQPNLLTSISQAFDTYMQDADLSEDAESIAEIGLVFSWATKQHRASARQWEREFYGWARLLIEEHQPYDVVCIENVAGLCDLQRYRLLILPDLAQLSADECRLLHDYVSGGGRILATGLAGPHKKDDPGLAMGDIFGVMHCEQIAEEDFAFEYGDLHAPATGCRQHVRVTGEILSHYLAVDPAGAVGNGHDPLPTEMTTWPAAVRNRFGDGESVYITFDAGRLYANRGDAHMADWLSGMLSLLLPCRALTVNAPRTVEVTLWRQQPLHRTIIHLANRTVDSSLPTCGGQIMQIIPVHNVELRLTAPPTAKVSARQTKVDAHHVKDVLIMKTSILNAYAAVIIDDS